MKHTATVAPFSTSTPTENLPDFINKNQVNALTVLFLTLIFLIRGPFLDSMVHIPDPTLSLFFIAGVYLRVWQVPIVLLAGAGLTDFYSFQSGVNTFCLSPAYPFLIPTYLSLWFGGKLFQNFEINSAEFTVKLIGVLFAATLLAFLISSGGFYLWSGRFENLTWVDFGGRIIKYFPSYNGMTFLYITIAVVFVQAKSYFRDELKSMKHYSPKT